jgi:hypothetical protein
VISQNVIYGSRNVGESEAGGVAVACGDTGGETELHRESRTT